MKNKGFFSRILSNDLVLMVLSLLLAFVIWFMVNASSQTESYVTISNIPITVELPQEAVDDGLEVFTVGEPTASVEVSGNRITVGSLTASDINIVALQSNSIITPGSYTLELQAKKVGVKTNYNFVSNVSPSNITVYVDEFKEKTFTITDDLVYKVEEGYYANSSFSESSVTVSGPKTEVMSIDKVVVQGELEGAGTTTREGNFELVYLDKDGNTLDINLCDTDVKSVKVTITPLPILEVELSLDVINAPKNYPAISINPRNIKIAAEQSVLDSIEDGVVTIGTLNFAELLNVKNELTYDIVLPVGCKNLSDTTTTNVVIDMSKYKTKTLTINSFSSSNIDLTKYSVVYNSSGIEVVVCGPSELISNINSSNVIAKVDFADKLDNLDKSAVSLELPLSLSFSNGYENCWAYGSYTVSVNVTQK